MADRPDDMIEQGLDSVLQTWRSKSPRGLSHLQGASARETVKYCTLRGITERSTQIEIAADVLADAVEFLDQELQVRRNDELTPKELLHEINKSANRYTMRVYRARKRLVRDLPEQHPALHDTRASPSDSQISPEALQRIVRAVGKIALQALEKLNDRDHDLLVREYGLADVGQSPKQSRPTKFSSYWAHRKAVTRASEKLNKHLTEHVRKELADSSDPEVLLLQQILGLLSAQATPRLMKEPLRTILRER